MSKGSRAKARRKARSATLRMARAERASPHPQTNESGEKRQSAAKSAKRDLANGAG